MKKLLLPSLLLLLCASGCCCFRDKPKAAVIPKVDVIRIDEPCKLDGKLDEPFWRRARVFSLSVYDNVAGLPELVAARTLKDKREIGRGRIVYDKDNVYVGLEYDDADVMQTALRDQAKHFLCGDTGEFFIGNRLNERYWELYGTPAGNLTSLFFRGVLYPPLTEDCFKPFPGYRVAVSVDGTLNDDTKADKGWNLEMCIPIGELSRSLQVKFEPGAPFTFLASRYNYNVHDRRPQLSSYPFMPQLGFHLVEYWADMNILP